MIKVDKVELFRVFIMLEIALVVLPIISLLCAGIVLSVVGFLVLGWLGAGLAYKAFPCVFGCYFLLPRLVASGFFRGEVPRFLPKGIAGWLVTVGVYSVLAFVLALLVSIYITESKQDRLDSENNGADGDKGLDGDETMARDRISEAT